MIPSCEFGLISKGLAFKTKKKRLPVEAFEHAESAHLWAGLAWRSRLLLLLCYRPAGMMIFICRMSLWFYIYSRKGQIIHKNCKVFMRSNKQDLP